MLDITMKKQIQAKLPPVQAFQSIPSSFWFTDNDRKAMRLSNQTRKKGWGERKEEKENSVFSQYATFQNTLTLFNMTRAPPPPSSLSFLPFSEKKNPISKPKDSE